MNRLLTLGSLFDGSGGFPLAGLLAGIVPVWSSEIEPFAIRVTEKRLPQVQHFGNISGLHGAKLPPVDIITFGSPCQDMSIAGRRSGLDGNRSSLFYEAIRIIKEMRNGVNRQVNCETANMNKTAAAAYEQIDNILLIKEKTGLHKLPKNLFEMAEVRLNYPELTIKELGEKMDPPVGKSGVYHRLKKLNQMAEELRNSGE